MGPIWPIRRRCLGMPFELTTTADHGRTATAAGKTTPPATALGASRARRSRAATASCTLANKQEPRSSRGSTRNSVSTLLTEFCILENVTLNAQSRADQDYRHRHQQAHRERVANRESECGKQIYLRPQIVFRHASYSTNREVKPSCRDEPVTAFWLAHSVSRSPGQWVP